MAFTSAPNNYQTSAQGFSHSINEAWTRSQNAYSLDSLKILGNRSIDETVNQPQKKIETLIRNGSISGLENQSNSFESWKDRSKALLSREFDIELSNPEVSIDNLTIETQSQFIYKGQIITETLSSKSEILVRNTTDPLASEIGPNYDIEKCDFQKLSNKLYEGDNSKGTARGIPIKSSAPDIETVPSPSDKKIIFTENVRRFEKDLISEYAGYVTLDEPPEPSSYNDNFVTDAPRLPSFTSDQRAIIYNGAWKSNFNRMIEDNCYFSTSVSTAPSIVDRLENRTTGSKPDGIFTLVDTENTEKIGKDSGESNILFQRANGTSDLVKLKGVTSADGIEWPYFRIGAPFENVRGLSELSNN
ncbi:hypothetical protein GLU64_03355 [Nanohaloarchaea archaeon]|nr:hypothetical protein [Candidatus Nanohaloarchaea archaeon]